MQRRALLPSTRREPPTTRSSSGVRRSGCATLHCRCFGAPLRASSRSSWMSRVASRIRSACAVTCRPQCRKPQSPAFFARRLRYFVPDLLGPHPWATPIVRQARVGFAALPEFVAFAWFRTATNSWNTTWRMSHGTESYRFGCYAVGRDCILHDASGPLVIVASSELRLHSMTWIRQCGLDVLALFLAMSAGRWC